MVSSIVVSPSQRWIWYRSTWSVPSRRSEASTAARMCLRDSPRSLGPGPIGKKTLVAST